MHITGLQLSNFMRISCLDVQVPASGAIRIGAANGEGKTSLYRFLEACFGGKDKLPPMPVKVGEKKAIGKVTLDDEGRCVTIEVEVEADRTLKATVRQDGGPAMKSPTSLLRGLVNTFTFDPLALLRLSGRAQRDRLLECLGVQFDDLDRQAEKLRQERTDCGRDVHGREKQIAAMPEHAGVPKREISTADLAEELQWGIAHNEKVNKFCLAVEKWESEQSEAATELELLREQMARAQKRVLEALQGLEKARAARDKLEAVHIEPIHARMRDADGINAKVRANAVRATMVEQFQADRERYVELGAQLDSIDVEKAKRLADAQVPVDGLSFSEGGVFYQGLPLAQDSGSRQIIRAVELSAALNPTLRAIFLDDAERLLTGRLSELNEWAEKNEFQVFCFLATEDAAGCQVVLKDGKEHK